MCCYFMANILRKNAFRCGLHMSIATKQAAHVNCHQAGEEKNKTQ